MFDLYDLYELVPGLRESVMDNLGCSDWDTSSAYDKYAEDVEASEMAEMLEEF